MTAKSLGQSVKPIIHIIDDTPANIQILAEGLSQQYRMRISTGGQEALVLLRSTEKPDLILLDVMMPEMDGYEVCRRIKADPALREIPVIFLTALSDASSESSGLQLGAIDYITKPINIDITRKRIHNHLEREMLRQEVVHHRDRLEEQVRERTRSLAIAKEAAETAHQFKTTILRNINHEFRTPMNGILGCLDMAERRVNEAEKLTEYLGLAKTAGRRLLATLTGLIDLAESESGRLSFNCLPFDPASPLQKLQNAHRVAAQNKGLQLSFEHLRDMPNMIGDVDRIEQIVNELIGNAVKFSASGIVSVSSSVIQKDRQAIFSVEVSDQGIGIDEKNFNNIFQPFFQIDGSETRAYQGNGIGLALCHRLAQAMGGSLEVMSTPGKGSTFTLNIPTEIAKDLPEITSE